MPPSVEHYLPVHNTTSLYTSLYTTHLPLHNNTSLYTSLYTTLPPSIQHYLPLYNTTSLYTTLPPSVQHYLPLYNTSPSTQQYLPLYLPLYNIPLSIQHTSLYATTFNHQVISLVVVAAAHNRADRWGIRTIRENRTTGESSREDARSWARDLPALRRAQTLAR